MSSIWNTLKCLVEIIAIAFLFALPVWAIWNVVVINIIDVKAINLSQAFGLLIVSGLLIKPYNIKY